VVVPKAVAVGHHAEGPASGRGPCRYWLQVGSGGRWSGSTDARASRAETENVLWFFVDGSEDCCEESDRGFGNRW